MRSRDQREEWADELRRTGRVELRAPRGKSVLLLLVSVVFTAVGIAMVTSGEDLRTTLFGWLSIGLFGVLGLPVLGWTVVTGGRRLVVTRTGVEVPGGFAVPWTDVRAVEARRVGRTTLVLLRCRDAEAQRRALSGHRLALALRGVSNAITRDTDLALPTPLPGSPSTLATWLRAVAADREPRA